MMATSHHRHQVGELHALTVARDQQRRRLAEAKRDGDLVRAQAFRDALGDIAIQWSELAERMEAGNLADTLRDSLRLQRGVQQLEEDIVGTQETT